MDWFLLLMFVAIFIPICEHVCYRYAVFSGGNFVRYEENPQFTRELLIGNVDTPVHTTTDFLDNNPSTPLARKDAAAFSSIKYSSEYRKRIFCNSSNLSNSHRFSFDGVIVVCYFLPVILEKDQTGTWSAKWNEESLLAKVYTTLSLPRVCWVGAVSPKFSFTEQDEVILTQLLLGISCFPIFLTRDLHHQFYNLFCKQHIAPLMHHSYDPYGSIDKEKPGCYLEQQLWYACTTVNQIFSTKIVEIYQKNDIIWIHGYHLMMLPSYIRRKIPETKIGIYLYTPFPSSEIWKTLWCRDDLLLAILCADQIGFLLFEYARHFMTTCRRMLGLNYEFSPTGSTIIRAVGRDVFIICMYLGVNNALIEKNLLRSDFFDQSSRYIEKFNGKTVITST